MDSLATLQKLGRGFFVDKLSLTLAEVSGEVAQNGGAGKVTVTFEIKKVKGEDFAVIVMEKIKRSPPTEGEHGAYLFVFEGELFQTDPRQPDMPGFRTVDTATGEVRQANEERTVRDA